MVDNEKYLYELRERLTTIAWIFYLGAKTVEYF